MSIHSTGQSRWLRNGQLARYLGVSNMTLWRWKRDPDLDFPDATEINGIEFNDLDRIDEWMRTRLVVKNKRKKG
jgi:predicted DNA-binding transcriptional regulator AlpA